MVRLIRRALLALAGALGVLVVGGLLLAWVVPLPTSPDLDPAGLAPAGTVFVDADGIRTPVEVEGPEDGPAVVLVHGFGGSTFSWRLTLPALAAAGYRAVALDLVNFGLTEKSWDADTTHAAQARHVLAVMDALGIRRAVVIGHSMGGNVAAHLAFASPARVAGLVLVDAAIVRAGSGSGPAQWLQGALVSFPPTRQAARQIIRRVIDEDRLTEILRSAYADPAFVTPAVAAGYRTQLRTRDWDLALLAVVREMGSNTLPASIATLQMPVLVTWGALDPWIPLSAGQALHDAIQGSSWAVIDGAGHLPFEEKPDAFMAALLPFLERVGETGR